ncbi:MAG: aminotransferase class I/II-fold pyridoxal phosphate-dependent enzyme [Pseudomonadota bacterium]
MNRIPLAIPHLTNLEEEAVLRCVRDNWVSSAGPEVAEFEKQVARYAGRQFAVATVNGTAALHLALMAVGVEKGDHVIVPDWTFAASANAIAHAGAVPHFVDVDREDWSLDPELTERAIAKDARVRAILAVDPLGYPVNADRLEAIAQRNNLPLIEDAAGALGGSYADRRCGSLGTVSTLSFNGNKTVTAGGGGMLLCDDEELAKTAKHISTQARPTREYIHDRVGYNYRMTNINAGIGLAQLRRINAMIAAKQRIAERYDGAIFNRLDIHAMPRPAGRVSSCWLYSVRVANEANARSLVDSLEADCNAEARIFWRSLAVQRPWQHMPRTLRGTSEVLSGTVVSLPCSSSLTSDQQDCVIECLKNWAGEPMQTHT